MSLPDQVTLVEVGPRDGLQNEKQTIPLEAKLQLIGDLAEAGLRVIEAGSFVNPKWIPQMADSEAVFAGLRRREGVRYTCLTPNLQGLERALAAGVDEVAVFGAASEAFSQKNINCSIDESLERFSDVMSAAREANVPVRGYVSCVLGCPYEGEIEPEAVSRVTGRLLDMGCYEVSLGDTIGTGTAGSMLCSGCCRYCWQSIPQSGWRCTATTPTARPWAIFWWPCSTASPRWTPQWRDWGVAPTPRGHPAMWLPRTWCICCRGCIETGLDLDKLIAAGNRISQTLGRVSGSKVALALSAA
jgi:hydroxymethylglutaryl-CoA lyase